MTETSPPVVRIFACGFLLALLTAFAGCRTTPLPVTRADFMAPISVHVYDFPDPNEVRGIIIYTNWTDARGFSLAGNGVVMVIGDQAELERILRTCLLSVSTVPDMRAVRRISDAYAEALAEARQDAAAEPHGVRVLVDTDMGTQIAFVTRDRIYYRDIVANGRWREVHDDYMISRRVWTELESVGYLDSTKFDPNLSDGISPALSAVCRPTTLPVSYVGETTPADPHVYDFPDPNLVRGILVYAGNRRATGFCLAGSGLYIVVGDKQELARTLHTCLLPRTTVKDMQEVRNISEAYSDALAAKRRMTARNPEALAAGKEHFPTPDRIAFVTDTQIYVRDFESNDRDMTAGDRWVTSGPAWREFERIGFVTPLGN